MVFVSGVLVDCLMRDRFREKAVTCWYVFLLKERYSNSEVRIGTGAGRKKKKSFIHKRPEQRGQD
jgi:hypothetical protein